MDASISFAFKQTKLKKLRNLRFQRNRRIRMTEDTKETAVAKTGGTAPTTLGGRLGTSLVKSAENAPTPVLQLLEVALGETEGSFSDTFYEKGKALLEKVGLLEAYLVSKGIETDGSISQWRPVLVGINSGKGKSAADLRHLGLNVLYNYGTKTAIDLKEKFYPVFIHGEEFLKDDSGMNVEDRFEVAYSSTQEAQTPGYDYQNIVYLLNNSFTEVFKITVKSSGHKFVTNLLRNYMYPNYKLGAMFNPALLKNWMTLDCKIHTSKKGFINPYARLTITDILVTADEARLIQIIQRSQFDIFKALMSKKKSESDEDAETQALVDDNTSTDSAGDSFTQL